MPKNPQNKSSKSLQLANLALSAANAANLKALRRESSERARHEALFRQQDAERSFAHWRQTEDGRTFQQWQDKYQRQVAITLAVEQQWFSAHREVAEGIIDPEDWIDAQSDTWTPPPHKTALFKTFLWAIPIGFVLAPLTSLITVTTGIDSFAIILGAPAIIAVWVGIAGVTIYGLFGKAFPSWQKENDQERSRRRGIRISQLGYDPLSESEHPPSIWKGEALHDAMKFQEIVDNTVVHHPSPSELFAFDTPQLIKESEVCPPQMVPHYRSITEELHP